MPSLKTSPFILEKTVIETYVTAAGNANGTDEGFPRNSGGVRNSEYKCGVRTTLLVVNRILFIRVGWAYRTNKVEVLVPAYSLHYGSMQWYTWLLSTKHEAVGTVPTGRYGAKCTKFPVLLLKDN